MMFVEHRNHFGYTLIMPLFILKVKQKKANLFDGFSFFIYIVFSLKDLRACRPYPACFLLVLIR